MKTRGKWERPSLAERLWAKVHKTASCWLWVGEVRDTGYGLICKGGPGKNSPKLRVHRVSWELHNGPITEGLAVLHRCDVRNCVNPDHLWLGTQTDNMRDCRAKSRGWEQQLNWKSSPNYRNLQHAA